MNINTPSKKEILKINSLLRQCAALIKSSQMTAKNLATQKNCYAKINDDMIKLSKLTKKMGEV